MDFETPNDPAVQRRLVLSVGQWHSVRFGIDYGGRGSGCHGLLLAHPDFITAEKRVASLLATLSATITLTDSVYAERCNQLAYLVIY